MLARDYRFDGKFFVGVRTTGIYCRPICPAKPKRQNVEFFKDAVSAEASGYRPCLRCRPESAPLSPAWIGKSATVQRALRLLAEDRLANEEKFAEQLGMSARHLRRLFEDEIGKTPKQIADSNRLDFSRKLIVETRIPFTEIAFTSGFSSIRRFNDAIQKRFSKSPRELRKKSTHSFIDTKVEITLSYRPPFDWESLLQFFRTHSVVGIENVTAQTYERVIKIEHNVGAISVKKDSEKHRLILSVSTNQIPQLRKITQAVRQMFDLDSDPLLIANSFSTSTLLDKLVTKFPGTRVPRGWDPFETVVCSILGQLVSTEQAAKLVGQLVRSYGEEVCHPWSNEKAFLFPTAELLARENLDLVGTTAARKAAIREFANLVVEKKISLESTQDPLAFRRSLLAIKGIGPWTAEYASLRAIGDTNAFPDTDLILRQVLKLHRDISLELLEPWRAYAAMVLWREFAGTLTRKKKRTNGTLLQEN